MAQFAVSRTFAKTNEQPADMELHDCFSTNESSSGLFSPGTTGELIDSNNNLPIELNEISSYVDDPSCFKVGPLFKILEEAMRDDTDNLIENVRGIYCFKVKNDKNQEGMWIINAKVGKGSVTYCGKDKPDVTFSMKDDDVFELISGKLNPQQAFFQGKVKIQGNMGLALKLTELQKKAHSKIEALKAKL